MKKEYKINGLDCANCAAKVEDAIKKINDVSDVSLNFMNEKLSYSVYKSKDETVYKQIIKTIDSIEDGITLEPYTSAISRAKQPTEDKSSFNIRKLRIFSALIIFAFGLLIPQQYDIYRLLAFIVCFLIAGVDVVILAFKNLIKGKMLDENFLMSIATIGAFLIGEYPEGCAVMIFYQVGEYFQDYATEKSRSSISSLVNLIPEFANVLVNNELKQVEPAKVEIGTTLVVKAGEKIPIDSVLIEGSSMIDTKSITGESVPRSANIGDELFSGTINLNSAITVKTTKLYADSAVAKILDLVENATANKSESEKFITKFAKYYTPIVVLLAIFISIVPPLLLGQSFDDWVYRALIFLVISCPCALVISVPLGFFGGIGASAKNGILVKGSNCLEALANADSIVFDKTGTLTKGVFTVQEIKANGVSNDEILEIAALAEYNSNHPIAKSIKLAHHKPLDMQRISNTNELSGRGLEVIIDDETVLVGNKKLMQDKNISFEENLSVGTVVYVAKNNKFLGSILIADELKEDTKSAITALKKFGLNKLAILSGDNKDIANKIAKEIGINDVHADLLPEEKVSNFLDIKSKSNKNTIFVGDGINDAPVLATADIGIAMGGLGSDAAIETADIVITNDECSKIATAIGISKKTLTIVKQNIVFAIGIKVLFLTLGFFGYVTMWESVFADVGVSVLAILNSMRILRYTDKKK